MPARNINTGCPPPISFYGCRNPGCIKSKCPKCSLKQECLCQCHTDVHLFYLTVALFGLYVSVFTVYEATGTVCTDTGARQLRGEPTPFAKHFINTSDNPPVSTAPYRLSPNRKELLRKEIDNLWANNIT
ncbi:hypothetical protein TNCV_3267731 [Trichonephila clavipes]|nr:hypothetical protein TNCV_3267731 [Trichonephila clavipes]